MKKKTRTEVICVEDSDDEELRLLDIIKKSETIFMNNIGKIDKNGPLEMKLIKNKRWKFIKHNLTYEFIGLLDDDIIIPTDRPNELNMFR